MMTRTVKIAVFLFLCLFIGAICQGAPTASEPNLAPYFTGYDGTFVLYDETADEYLVYNLPRSEKRLPPCSTFKIANSLIALETGVAPDETMVIPWNGKPGYLKSWDRDHTMASAIANSVVWYYQELATRIGAERMQKHLNSIPYGNRDISGGITEFWLTSSLEISAMEQVDFLRRLFRDELPFSKTNMAIVRRIIRLDSQTSNFYGKTGSGRINDVTTIGWFVGAVEKDGKRFIFATNITGSQDATGIKARAIATDILKASGIL